MIQMKSLKKNFSATISNPNFANVTISQATATATIAASDTSGGATFEAEVIVLTDIPNTLNINEGNRDIELQMYIPNADTDNLIVDFNVEVIGVSATAGSDFYSRSCK